MLNSHSLVIEDMEWNASVVRFYERRIRFFLSLLIRWFANNSDFLATRRSGCKMAAQIRQSLAGLINSGLSPKELTEKYRKILNRIVELKNEELVEGLKSFIDAGLLDSGHCLLEHFL